MRDAHAAEDVTQAVFIILARKAAGFKRDVILSSWLLQTTAYAVKNFGGRSCGGVIMNKKAAAMKTDEARSAANLWERMEPAIDDALRSLATAHRDAVVLRYFDGQSYEEIARRLKHQRGGGAAADVARVG
jgi:RNA polymerase sigma factor (sigma-70 family)